MKCQVMHLWIKNKNFTYNIEMYKVEATEEERNLGTLVNG